MSTLRQAFEAILELAPAARAAAIDALPLDPAERTRLHAMLQADGDDSLLDVALAATVGALRDGADPAARLIGTRAGPFLLEAPIGEGGSAVVFRARREVGTGVQFAAVKLLHPGLFSPRAARRFEREQAILASLSHPHIARLIDAGVTAQHQPYLAMELVDGTALTEHADAAGLGLRERLVLFGTLCDTVDAAHAASIIHRDLKPSNVLVSRAGELKVLDFGIARPQDDDHGVAATATVSLTPEYAAPEQFHSGHATVAVDVFALGVMLAELLTGQRLREGRASAAVLRRPQCLPPPLGRARDAARALRGDLDAIVARALAETPQRRYRSARDFAQDVRRHLAHQPVQARRGSTWYVARRFLRRHWIAAAVSAALLLGLLASLALAYRHALRADDAATRALAQAQRADSMRAVMFDVMAEAEPATPRAGDVTVKDALRRAVARIGRDAALDARARSEMLVALADTLGRAGDGDAALHLLRDAHADATARFGADDPLALDAALQRAKYENQRGEHAAARALVDALLARDAAADPARHRAALRLSASIAWHQRDRSRALADAREAVRRSREDTGADDIAQSLASLGAVLVNANENAAAAELFTELLALHRARFGEQHEQTALAHSGLARALRRLGRLDEAEAASRSAIAIDRAIYPDGHWILANHLNALTLTLHQQRRFDAALAAGREGIDVSRRWLAPDHPDLFFAIAQVGLVLTSMERYAEALPFYRDALDGRERTLGAAHFDTAVTRAGHGFALGQSGDADAGLQALARAIADIDAAPSPDHEQRARALDRQATLALDAQRRDIADVAVARLQALADEAPASAWPARARLLQARLHAAHGRLHDALASCDAGLARATGEDAAARVLRIELLAVRAEAAARLPDGDAARAARDAARSLARDTPGVPPSLLARLQRLD